MIMNIYSDEFLLAVWQKAEEVQGVDSRIWRKDFAGAWIRYDHYGMKDAYGWQIDHQKPHSHVGSDEIANLSPLLWQNNQEKSENYPFFSTRMTSQGSKNIEKKQSWQILQTHKD